jgi:thioredoxin-dependent peroxiredoxin
MVKEGKKAPDFTGISDSGEKFSLSDFLGKKVVLYFYPRDNTPGCTKEACDFRDNSRKFENKDIIIIGVSPDTTDSHIKFKEKFGLPFILIADEEKKIIKKYDVWKEKNMYGKKVMGVERTTFLIDEKGVILRIYPKVKVDGHIEQILLDINQ